MARQPTIPGQTDRRIDALMTLLATRPMLAISGARIAREIGVSRSSVWRWVEKLRSLGVRVKGEPHAGYRLERAADVLVPGLLNPLLRGTIFHNHVHHFFKAGSTNEIALELGRRGAPAGTVVIAEEQSNGRGRLGRNWHSEKARGIYASVLLRPAIAPGSAAMLTIVAGLAAREAVYRQTGLEPDIRWPNDLLLGGRKFAGILTEMQAQPDRIEFVVVGVGINVNHEKFPEPIEKIATSLRIESAREQSRVGLLAGLLHELERHYNRWMTEGSAPMVERFSQVSSLARGKRVRVENAAESFTGTTDGIEPGGWLRVRRDDGRVEPVISGDVREVA